MNQNNIRAPDTTSSGTFTCQCGRPVFFRNSECLACHTPLGYAPEQQRVLPLQASSTDEGSWIEYGSNENAWRFYRCSGLTASGCNWLVDVDDVNAGDPPQCRSCRLTRTLPDLSIEPNPLWWHRIEVAKRRLVAALIGMGLPVRSILEDPERGLAFDLLRSDPGTHVITGHINGVITLDVEEADDATREQRRGALHEPYRTLLGHLRHESGHYYWQRLVDGSEWLEPCRVLFGDEQQDYAAALQSHYDNGPPADWNSHFVSAYASSHPWEDWAETWAHYLYMTDTLQTARSFGLDTNKIELHFEAFPPEVLESGTDPNGEFLSLLNSWVEFSSALNELSRSMGVHDFYPFVLSMPAARKLHFVHRVVTNAAGQET